MFQYTYIFICIHINFIKQILRYVIKKFISTILHQIIAHISKIMKLNFFAFDDSLNIEIRLNPNWSMIKMQIIQIK